MTTTRREEDEQRSHLTRALLALKDVRAQLDEARRANAEPVAVIGIGCRFPGGVMNPDDYWRLLERKGDAITEVPPGRWDVNQYYDPNPDAPGKVCTRYGGFLDGVDLFDAEFFGITPREAVSMDPQQRLLLETAWESLEHAGLAPDRLRGSATGVFVGLSSSEYSQLVFAAGPAGIDSYAVSGNAHSIAAGRLSYTFGFRGPCIAVDTACSSSLAAVHLACQSLRRGECKLAIAGGVNVLLTPAVSINHTRARMLAPDGRCKAFDGSADGFVRSEGCGLIVLKPLSRAVADRDDVLSVIRGSAINQDGRTSGLTVPSGPSQQAVIRAALKDAGLDPCDVSYVEAHGTGTSLGDPIELNALVEIFGGRGQSRRPLVVGSVKTNIGHAEAAAGIAGAIKVILAYRHGVIPPQLHFQRPNPHVAWDRLSALIPSEPVPWGAGEGLRVAGVSSFGFGGTNVHLVLSEPPDPAPDTRGCERPLHVLALSARTDDALKTLATLFAAHLAHLPDADLADVCHTANTGRSPFSHRLTVIAEAAEAARAKLAAFADGRETSGLARGCADASGPPQVAFLFTGQGSQYVGMGRELFDFQPAFRRDMEQCDQLLRPWLKRPLLEVLYADSNDGTALGDTGYTQPALFALEYCLGRLWMLWGVVPGALMGHSVGEYAAACLAGVFPIEDGIELIAARARLMQALPRNGGMLAVCATENEIRDTIASWAPDLSIAAVNGPRDVVVSGYQASLDGLTHRLDARGVECRRLIVSHAFHSTLVEPMLADFERVAARVRWSPPRTDLVSNLTGGLAGPEVATPDYWVRHARATVRFSDGVRALHQQGCGIFLEVGPQPVLLAMGRRCLPEGMGQWLPSLRSGQSNWRVMLDSLSALYLSGTPIDWARFDDGYPRRRCHLPTYPFQRRRYWVKQDPQVPSRSAAPGAEHCGFHPLLGTRLHLARHCDEALFEAQISVTQPRFLADHRVFGAAIMPAAGYVEMALAAGAAVLKSEPVILENVMFHKALALPAGQTRTVQMVLSPGESGGYGFEILSRPEARALADEPCWTTHASGTLRVEAGDMEASHSDLADLRRRIAEPVSIESFYDAYARVGVTFAGSLRAVHELWRARGEALGRIRLPEDAGDFDDYRLHPVLLDAAAQVLGAASDRTDGTYIQSAIRRVRVYRRPGRELWGYARLQPPAEDLELVGDLRLIDEAGMVVAAVTGQEAKRVHPGSFARMARSSPSVEFYEPRWLPSSRSGSLPSPAAVAAKLRPLMDRAVVEPALVAYGAALAALESLPAYYIAHAFTQLGWALQPLERFETHQLQASLGVAETHTRLLGRLLEILEDEGALRPAGRQWEVLKRLTAYDLRTAFVSASQKAGAALAELEVLDRCGSRLADVLSGRQDPLDLLFPDGDLASASSLYRDSPGSAAMNRLLREAVARITKGWPATRPLRVLEVGAGTGAATEYVLPILPPDQTEYVFSDISTRFLSQARSTFSGYPFVKCEILDVERNPAEQGFAGCEFDVVIAFNVLHATSDLRRSVRHVRGLLRPGGVLLLLENTEPAKWVDMIWGLTPGWWRFSDGDLRPSYPLLPEPEWRTLLKGLGFSTIESVAPDPQRHGVTSTQTLIIAQSDGLGTAGPTCPDGAWLMLAGEGGLGEELAIAFEASGVPCAVVRRGRSFLRLSDTLFELNPTVPDDYRRLLDHFSGHDGPALHGVVHLWGLDALTTNRPGTAALTSDSVDLSGSAVFLVQALCKAELRKPPRLWLVTRASQAVCDGRARLEVAQATICGVGKVIALEHPENWGGMIDLDPEPTPDDAANLMSEILAPDDEDQIAFRGGQRFVPRVARACPRGRPCPPVRSDGVYLIVGGFGALGLETARWLVRRGARHLALIGRSGPSAAAETAVSDLERQGVRVYRARADVADEIVMRSVLDELERDWPPLRGLVHAAGLPGSCAVAAMDRPTLERMFAAKVAGAWNLHALTRGRDLDFFVCFSSMVSIWGAKGQSHYVAANYFLDMLTHHRRSLGLPSLCVNWGPLTGGGMLPADHASELARLGVATTGLSDAMETLETLLGTDVIQAAAVAIDWRLFKGMYESRRRRPMFDLLGTRPAAGVSGRPPDAGDVIRRLECAAAGDRREILAAHVRSVLVRVLGLEPNQMPDDRQGFFDMGMDSLTAMELRANLETNLATELPSTLAFDYATVGTLADFLLKEKLGLEPRERDRPEPDPPSDGRAMTSEMLERLSDEDVERLLIQKLEQS
jgi:acyl transferase domain-containing protein/acyl carrier protein/ubiquinone/menaquinone biosynthesis C-methylase UbiE